MIIFIQRQTINTGINSKTLTDSNTCLMAQTRLNIIAEQAEIFISVCLNVFFNFIIVFNVVDFEGFTFVSAKFRMLSIAT